MAAPLVCLLACGGANHGNDSGAGGSQSGGTVTTSIGGASAGSATSKDGGPGTATSPGGGAGGLSTSTGDAGMVWGTDAAADFERRFSDAFCQFFARCRVSPSVAVCKADSIGTMTFDLNAMVENIKRGRTLYARDKAEPCFKLFANALCTSFGWVDPWPDPACVYVLKGTVSDGEKCVVNSECAAGRCHSSACGSDCCPGTCGPPFPVGAACDPSSRSDGCVSDARCVGDGKSNSTGTCWIKAAQGQPCGDGAACQYGLGCGGTCKPFPAPKDGQACTRDGFLCDNTLGSFCDSATGICQPRLPVGSACSMSDARASTPYPNCVQWADCVAGRCVPRAEVGESCGAFDGGDWLNCRDGLCTNGVCETGPVGPPCPPHP